MADRATRLLLLADFTIENLAGLLANDSNLPPVEPVIAPFDSVMPVLLDSNRACWKERPSGLLIWTRPEGVCPSFGRAMTGVPVRPVEVMAEVDQFAEAVISASGRVSYILMPTWVLPSYNRGGGLLAMRQNSGLADLIMRMNLRLSDKLTGQNSIYLLDTGRWVASIGKHAFSPKLWYMGKIAFGNPLLEAAVSEIKAAIRGLSGEARKLVILDLDDTLWGGVVGEVGYENLRLGGHDPVGEAFADFQQSLKALKRRGVLLALVSKNDEEIALEAISKHPEMVLTEEDFAARRINWSDKAHNVMELVAELDLGLQSVVFIDDNPVERDRVGSALPDVLVPDWPSDPMLYASTLQSMTCFDSGAITAEDLARSEMYQADQARQRLHKSIGSVNDWLEQLQTIVTVERWTSANRERTVQLLNKTNQMNLSTRRLSATELEAWLSEGQRWLCTFRVSDKFGDSGLTGLVGCEEDGDCLRLIDFVLSCRVIGRRVEETMLHTVVAYAKETGVCNVVASPIATPRNGPCREFFKRSGFHPDQDETVFNWPVDQDYPLPAGITLKRQ